MIRILESTSTLTALEKMQAFDAGTRRENIKACSDVKLINYYKICIENNLQVAADKLAGELLYRDMLDYIAPTAQNIESVLEHFAADDQLSNDRLTAIYKENPVTLLAKSQRFWHNSNTIIAIWIIYKYLCNDSKRAGELNDFVKNVIGTYTITVPKILDTISPKPSVNQNLDLIEIKLKKLASGQTL